MPLRKLLFSCKHAHCHFSCVMLKMPRPSTFRIVGQSLIRLAFSNLLDTPFCRIEGMSTLSKQSSLLISPWPIIWSSWKTHSAQKHPDILNISGHYFVAYILSKLLQLCWNSPFKTASYASSILLIYVLSKISKFSQVCVPLRHWQS